MTNFSGGGFKVTEGTSSKPGKSIKPGVHVAKIKEVKYYEATTGTPAISFTYETKPVDGLEENGKTIGQRAYTTLWMSPKAWDKAGDNGCTKAQLSIMADKLGVRDDFDAIDAGEDAEAFVNAVKPLLEGKRARFAFGGKTVQKDFGDGPVTFITPETLRYGFIESLDEVPNDEDTKLKVDVDNKFHVKPLEEADAVSSDGGDSPFKEEVSDDWD